jgi:hypothetical protein
MAGCDAHNEGGDDAASRKRITGYAATGASIGAVLALIAALGPLSWALVLTVLAGAVAGLALGFFVGSAYDWFRRLKEQSPSRITILGRVKCAGRNPLGFQPFSDGDWTCNMGELTLALPTDLPITNAAATTQIDEVRFRAAPGSDLPRAYPSFNEEAKTTPILHCEITALAGNFSVTGGAIGSVAGAAAGGLAGAAACAALGLFTFGIGAALCLLILAAAVAAGAVAGGVVGSLVGAFLGWLADELSDFDALGESIEEHQRYAMFITGRWVTDLSHEHNEIHDIEAVQIVFPRRPDTPPPPTKDPIIDEAGIVGIGRRAAPTTAGGYPGLH